MVERYVYTPFGGVTIYQCSGNSWTQAQQVGASPNNNTILFAGMRLDPTTGLYYDNARWYDPGSGAFITRDPMGYAAGDPNLYRYCGNNPTSATDPTGLRPELYTVAGGGVQGTFLPGNTPATARMSDGGAASSSPLTAAAS